MKKIGIYDRYLSTAGGGERYSCKIAEVLSSRKEFEVDLITDIFVDLKEISGRLNIDLERVNLKLFPIISEDYAERMTKKYDIFINATYLSSLSAYGKRNLYLCYFPTPFDIDFRLIHKLLLFFFRLPALWLFKISNRLSHDLSGLEVIEGLYDIKRFILRRGSWSNGRVVLKVKETARPFILGFKNPKTSNLNEMSVNIEVYNEAQVKKSRPLYHKKIRLKKGVVHTSEVPLSFNDKYCVVIISSDTFIPLEAESCSQDSRKLGTVVYNRSEIGFFKKVILKILGYIPLFLVTFPKDYKFLETYHRIITISQYSKKWVKRLWGRLSTVLYPPVDIDNFKSGTKEKIILSVGRFFPEHHNKKQLEMAEIFKKMFERYPVEMKDYALYLVGGVDRRPDHLRYVEKIKEVAKNYPIKVITNVKWPFLVELFSKSRIFWHAAGVGEDEETSPEKFEHFGITTVEAMAAGCIPVVINKGGQKEIINDRYNGFLFESWEELENITIGIIRGEVDTKNISKKASKDCRRFSNSNFKKGLLSIIDDLLEK
jgi:glycosyltransferase involved in cell wall biosynthesis